MALSFFLFLYARLVAGEISGRVRRRGILLDVRGVWFLKIQTLKKFRLYLNDRTIVLHNVQVFNTGRDIRIISNPLTLSIKPVKPIGICVFDVDGIIGRINRLPKFIWKMLQNNNRKDSIETKRSKNFN